MIFTTGFFARWARFASLVKPLVSFLPSWRRTLVASAEAQAFNRVQLNIEEFNALMLQTAMQMCEAVRSPLLLPSIDFLNTLVTAGCWLTAVIWQLPEQLR